MGDTTYDISQKVLVYQGPLLYDAKITKKFDPINQKVSYYDEKRKESLSVAPDKKFPNKFLSNVCYMIHYNGWNVKWDEWVLPSRVLEANSENLMLKDKLESDFQEKERLKREAIEELEALKEEEKKNKGKEKNMKLKEKNKIKLDKKSRQKNGNVIDAIINNGNTNSNGNSKKKNSKDSIELTTTNVNGGNNFSLSNTYEGKFKRRKINGNGVALNTSISKIPNSVDGSTHYESKTGFTHYEIKNLIPSNLKILLIDDWENITKNNKLVTLPSKCTVSQTLQDFKKYIIQEFNGESIFLEITESLKQYFEQALGTLLLYRYERLQYKEIIQNPSIHNLYDVYGTIYFLRLISIFPNILNMNNIEPNSNRTSKIYLDVLLNWLDLNKDKYLIDSYENQTPWVSLING